MDRLSGLPDELISHIISFLPTKSFVQTSILAKEWRFFWTRVPSLGFTVDEPKTINNFPNTTDDELKSWIDTIFARNVRNTVIRLNYQLALPQCLFTSNTLVDLCIMDSGDLPKSGTVYFPALKKLQLVNVGYASEESLAHLTSGCPLLEELIIDRMMLNYSYSSLPKETNVLMDMRRFRLGKSKKPALRYLRIRAYEIPYISIWEVHSLVEADIDMSEGQISSTYLFSDFLHRLNNVKRLTLSSRRIEIPESVPFYSTEFLNLTELDMAADWRFITHFFGCAKNLRVLTISKVDCNAQCWAEPRRVPACLVSSLETVNLVDFEWSTEEEFEMVKYILCNARVLKTMEIMYTAQHIKHNEEFDWNKKVEALNRLASFEKRTTCISLRLKLLV